MQVCKHRQRRKCWLVRLAPLRQALRNRGAFLFLKKVKKSSQKPLLFLSRYNILRIRQT
nr:MAG TPA: hypothetical protein [Caudoviricetes sp.]